MAISLNDRRFLIHLFPGLASARFHVRSPRTNDYNCFGWAATGAMALWWEPRGQTSYWPAGVAKANTMDAFLAAFGTVRYAPVASAVLEPGVEKVALYALGGKPTHAARQLANGWWTSKVGQYWDIEHENLGALEGEEFGAVACILGRKGGPALPIGEAGEY